MAARALAAGVAAALCLWTGAPRAAEVRALFPSDRFTVLDPDQPSGRRVSLAGPGCARPGAGCDEVRLLNRLDGFSVRPRVAIRFSAPIRVDTVMQESAFVLPLEGAGARGPLALDQLVWDEGRRTLYGRPARMLLQRQRHALVVTTRVRARDGRALGATAERIEPLLLERLREVGVEPGLVAGAAVFTTQSVTGALEQIRAVIQSRPAPTVRFDLEPGGRSVYPRAALEGVEWQPQVGAGPRWGDPVPLPLGLLPPAEVGTIAFGRFRSLSFLDAGRSMPAAPGRRAPLAPREEGEVHLTLFLPAGLAPAAGWPVAIFGHGYGGDRHLVPALVAATLARHGIATAAIDAVGHGGGPEGRLLLARAAREPVALASGGRGLDLDGDGRIGPTEGLATPDPGPLALIGPRDGLRQTVADLIQLVRAIRGGVDVDGDGRPDLDGARVHYVGQSLGGIYGTLLMAVEPHLRAGVLNVAGGPLVEIARLSPVFRGLVVERLRARRPPLLNGEGDFFESLPMPGEPPLLAPAPGALEIQAYLERAEWLGQPASPVAWAPYLRLAPLGGGAPRAVLYQWALGDVTVPNPTTAALLRAGALEGWTSLYRHDALARALPERLADPHGFLAWTGLPEGAAVARAAQEQAARFLLTGRIERTDERFEIPAGR